MLDSEGLAKAVLRAREVTQWLALARADDLRVITSAATVVEVTHPRLSQPALEWTLSRVVVEPVTEPIARRATAILAKAGLHGHRYAIDAMLAATALAAAGPVTILASDPEDIATLCGRHVTVIKVLRGGPGKLTRGQTNPRRFFQGSPKRCGDARRRFSRDGDRDRRGVRGCPGLAWGSRRGLRRTAVSLGSADRPRGARGADPRSVTPGSSWLPSLPRVPSLRCCWTSPTALLPATARRSSLATPWHWLPGRSLTWYGPPSPALVTS